MIQLQNVVPSPLEETGINPDSQIWATDCAFEVGKKYLVTAPSGKGKSTLVHLIYGLRKDFTGDIAINQDDTRSIAPETWSSLRQKKISIVFQDLRLFPQLTAMENILLKSDLTNAYSPNEIKDIAERLNIESHLNKPISTLSYGQRQRIAIIRALCQPFEFLLLDEPFSHLDEANIKAAVSLILEACEVNEAGLILVSLQEDYGIDYDVKYVL